EELLQIAELMVRQMDYRFDAGGAQAMREYIALRVAQPHFANARSIRNALDRARLRQAARIFAAATGEQPALPSKESLMCIGAGDIRASRVFRGGFVGNPHIQPVQP
ncbi:MAG: CbbX protein, partial [Burkholderiaceae bacterium]|nr:CbbX protein [Burkholderiaceae bacterium]